MSENKEDPLFFLKPCILKMNLTIERKVNRKNIPNIRDSLTGLSIKETVYNSGSDSG